MWSRNSEPESALDPRLRGRRKMRTSCPSCYDPVDVKVITVIIESLVKQAVCKPFVTDAGEELVSYQDRPRADVEPT